MGDLSLFEHLSGQLTRMCDVAETDPSAPLELLGDLLGTSGSRSLAEGPAWPSQVADDHTPVEFSVAFNEGEPPTLRILGEVLGTPPGVRANLSATRRFLSRHADLHRPRQTRLDSVQDLFLTEDPQGAFGLWCSLVFRHGRLPEFKVYLNPEVKGVERAPDLVAEALRQLGLEGSYRRMLDHGIRPGELGRRDRLTFFALDLHDGPQARVKLYLTHHDAEVRDVVRAAGAVDGVDGAELAEFCVAAGGGTHLFDGRPLVGSYTFTRGAEKPVGYSVYVPIRDYVSDDEEARERVVALLARYGFDSGELDRTIAAVTQRPLGEGTGLIAHVSLRLGPPRPGVTVYLSAEAYGVGPARPRRVPAVRNPVEVPAGRSTAGHL
ncbi:tryptophan dimethylallyltransferase family protein [Plantactinospora sp. CA-290183]|uniref:tryptophan dimethylallyltransferase family protein n=1 Tax=Plantactinospora sp. CA-290183 TaxID=3240006 RepID=UPI003D94D95B